MDDRRLPRMQVLHGLNYISNHSFHCTLIESAHFLQLVKEPLVSQLQD